MIWTNGASHLYSILLSLEHGKFHRLPNGTFGLLEWYDQAVIKRAEERKQNGSAEAAEAEPEAEEGEKASAWFAEVVDP